MLRILIVDDEDSIRNTLTWLLEREGYLVKTEKDFEGAKEIIQRADFDIYIIDVFLPDRNGLELIKYIKDLEKDGVIVIISGYPNVPTLIDSMRLDAFDYIQKPFSLSYLKIVIDHILSVQDALFGYEIKDEYVDNQTK